MPKFLIERDIPGIGQLTTERLAEVSRRSNEVLHGLGPDIQWLESYITGDKMTCVYIAPDAELVREHARRGGFPADHVEEIRAIVDPTTSSGAAYITPASQMVG